MVPCSVSAKAGGLAEGSDDVTAIWCGGRAGFFVPSHLYRELREDEGTVGELELERAKGHELTLAVEALTKASSASSSRADLYRRAWLDERAARAEDEPGIEAHPGLWIAVGATIAIGVLAAASSALASSR